MVDGVVTDKEGLIKSGSTVVIGTRCRASHTGGQCLGGPQKNISPSDVPILYATPQTQQYGPTGKNWVKVKEVH
jgi:hypothetical protein